MFKINDIVDILLLTEEYEFIITRIKYIHIF